MKAKSEAVEQTAAEQFHCKVQERLKWLTGKTLKVRLRGYEGFIPEPFEGAYQDCLYAGRGSYLFVFDCAGKKQIVHADCVVQMSEL